MDLLGSILGKMEKPPVAAMTKERELAKKQQEKLDKIAEAERKKLKAIREKLQKRVEEFAANDDLKKMAFEPMDQTLRTMLRDICEIAGLTSHSFGVEDIDRHVVVFKSNAIPTEDELNCLRRGEVYDPIKIKLAKEAAEREEEERLVDKGKQKVVPNTNYQEKYEHLIGIQAGKESAQATVCNKSFGFVPSANKSDKRSIEQTLADLREKKRAKVADDLTPKDEPGTSIKHE